MNNILEATLQIKMVRKLLVLLSVLFQAALVSLHRLISYLKEIPTALETITFLETGLF